MKVNFILAGEGVSDLRLVEHIENILVEEGFSEASGEAPDLRLYSRPTGCSVKNKLETLLKYYPETDAVFVHRDADRVGVKQREDEIICAAENIYDIEKIIPVIPVTMLETWLLADQDALKRVAGNASLRGELSCIPAIRSLEKVSDAKKMLLEALCEASKAQGSKLSKFKKRFSEMRARLTFDLDSSGPVNDLDSYKYFREKVREFARRKLDL